MMAATLSLKLVHDQETRLASLQTEPAPPWIAFASLIRERFGLHSAPAGVTYVDVEGDAITVSSDEEVAEMLSSFEGQSSATVNVVAERGHTHPPSPAKPSHGPPRDPKTKELLDKIRRAVEADPSLGHEIHLILHEGGRHPHGPGRQHRPHDQDHSHGPPPQHSGPAGRGRGGGPGHRCGGHRHRHRRGHSRGHSPSSGSDSSDSDSDSEGQRRHAPHHPPPPPPPLMHGFPAPPPFGFPFHGPPSHAPPPHPPHFGHGHPRHQHHLHPCGFSHYAAHGYRVPFPSFAPPPPSTTHAFCPQY
ncbi:hypothetical protein BMF94_3479 [Rhodotorula taiwanensis]|uniref:PB1 domain-containing protein n=1 Tax=Rhodotorula taiwanensis TaxID=741276 RepID=A0A2S5B9Z0_9BASI|nr:hypothetical protein BMF94_3479 [Rhodotorula taiwanensis]